MKNSLTVTSEGQQAYLNGKKINRIRIHFFRIILLICFLAVWQVSAMAGLIDTFFFSSPFKILSTFIEGMLDKTLPIHIGITLFETIISFFIIIILGLFISSILWFFPKIGDITEPFLIILNSLPKSALAPLIIVWFGTKTFTIILCGISVAIFGAILNVYHGFMQTDSEKLKLIATLGGTRLQAFTKVVLPGCVPLLLSISKVNIGLCLVGVIIGEFLAGRRGLGYLIIYGSQVFKLHLVIMSIVILCIIAMVLYQCIQLIEKKISY